MRHCKAGRLSAVDMQNTAKAVLQQCSRPEAGVVEVFVDRPDEGNSCTFAN